MAIERTLTSVCLRTGALLLVLAMTRANAVATGSVERRGTSVDEHEQKVTSVPNGLTNSSSSTKAERLPIYLKPGNGSGVGCVELRSKRYVSDGHCTSIRPLIEVVCSGLCLPIRTLPWYTDYVKAWAGTSSMEWQCVDDVARKRKVTLICEDGTTRSYRVRIVKNCRCKQTVRRRHASAAGASSMRGSNRGGGDHQAAEKGDLDRPREVSEKRRKHGRRKLRHHKFDSTSQATTLSAT